MYTDVMILLMKNPEGLQKLLIHYMILQVYGIYQ